MPCASSTEGVNLLHCFSRVHGLVVAAPYTDLDTELGPIPAAGVASCIVWSEVRQVLLLATHLWPSGPQAHMLMYDVRALARCFVPFACLPHSAGAGAKLCWQCCPKLLPQAARCGFICY